MSNSKPPSRVPSEPASSSSSSGSPNIGVSPPLSPPYSSSPTSDSQPVATTTATTTTPPDNQTPGSIHSPSSPDSIIQLTRSSPIEEQPPQLKYTVASHSVRITKHGYAIDPVELRYPEIINNLSSSARRSSEFVFDGGQTGHRILSLIRGFWSQPGFPRGKQFRNDKLNSINAMLNEFSQYPLYPHEDTLGGMAKARPKNQQKRVKKIVAKSPRTATGTTTAAAAAAADQPDDLLTRAFFNDPSHPSSPPLNQSQSRAAATTTAAASSAKTSQTRGNDILSLFISKQSNQTRSPPPATNVGTPRTPPIRSSKGFHSWLPKNKDQAYELVLRLLHKMERIFSSELRIINVSSPCTVLGDIHGNLIDLRTYERSLWPKAPNCLASNYLFLGDYVDRGEYSVECVLYLMAMKSLVPNRFYLLRGNHEVAAIQRQYTFGRECETKFGSYGRDLWLAFNKVFDLMPVAAIIDNQIFCAHGGIPRTISDVRNLAEEIPTPLDNPELQCPAAWEILWNDPITDSELIGMIEMDNAIPTTAIQMTQQSPSPPQLPPSQQPPPPPQSQITATTQPQPKTTATATKTTTTKVDSPSSDIEEFNAAMNRQQQPPPPPPSASLSSYINPDNSQQSGLTAAIDQAKSIAKASKEAGSMQINNNQEGGRDMMKKDDDNSNRLRKVPSDTSSIASTSPQQIMNDGFIANIKRGTAFLFSDQAVSNFLKLNKLSHVIRAHEVIPTGFAFHGEGRVITIFSSSKYCGLNNQAACALVEREKIRILRLDTGDAGE